LGTAGPTVGFTLLKAWILDPLPFEKPDALTDIRTRDRVSGNTMGMNTADFADFERQATSFESLAGYTQSSLRLTDGNRAEALRGAEATATFFRTLGAHPAAGRLFDVADSMTAAPNLAIVSHALWRDRFGADPGLIGRTIRLQGDDYTVIGVLPDGFQFT